MTRPVLANLTQGQLGADTTINNNKAKLVDGPFPVKEYANFAALPAAGSYDRCIAALTDEGVLVISNGTIWLRLAGGGKTAEVNFTPTWNLDSATLTGKVCENGTGSAKTIDATWNIAFTNAPTSGNFMVLDLPSGYTLDSGRLLGDRDFGSAILYDTGTTQLGGRLIYVSGVGLVVYIDNGTNLVLFTKTAPITIANTDVLFISAHGIPVI